ncbi:hypothetical protein AWC24_07615 [Mycolicibacter senuensis]|uniref:Membrane protein n=1 Tax=Mycolicibacter senuensis TaxID=386913 RepID=A0A7I9XIZ3_9MYCO|nr:hypothetical protein AWC24_07615 [Mycolicibacter senuensis]GFG69942.1 membrane protein [Mycolicibacter senuensis]
MGCLAKSGQPGRSLAVTASACGLLFGIALTSVAPSSRADVEPDKKLAYLIGVTMRPGYDFANAEEALDYGYGICGKVSHNIGYAQLITDVQGDFATSDDYHASYLISQAVNELCPELIWQLRNSAAHYRPPGPRSPKPETGTEEKKGAV